MKDWYSIFNLQRFAEGGAGDGGAAAGDAGAAGAAQTGVTEADAAPQMRRRAKSNPLANVRYGIQPEETTRQANNEAPDAAEQNKAQRLSFEDLLKSDPQYKADYDAKVRKAIDGRFRQANQTEARMNQMQPIIQAIAAHYGIDASDPAAIDLDGLMKAVGNDRKMYEDEALREGVPVELLMQRKQLERQQAAFDAQQAAFDAQQRRATEEANARREMTELLTAATALRETIPGFDIDREMQNPNFAKLALKPPRGAGVPLESAYYAVHHAEIEQARRAQQYQSMQAAQQQTAQKLANAVMSGSMRPSENGSGGNPSPAAVRSDPSSLKLKDFAEISKRVAAGEKIKF